MACLNKSILPLLGKSEINWYSEPKYWPVILVIVNTWKGVGYGCLIYISSISGIDPSFYEAAELDGATKWKQIKYITLPSILPSVITLTLLNIGRIFYSDFGLFYQVTQIPVSCMPQPMLSIPMCTVHCYSPEISEWRQQQDFTSQL